MAEQEGNKEPTAPTAGHSEPDPPSDPLAALTSSGKELLEVSLDVLKDLSPEPGALNDFPQVSVCKEHIMEACRLMKTDSRISASMLLCLACVDYTNYFQFCLLYTSPSPRD